MTTNNFEQEIGPIDTYINKPLKKFEVVVARYSENLSWLPTEFPNTKITVYNKGNDDLSLPENAHEIKLPNLGREAQSYLYHIVKNYNDLPDRTFFVQGHPFDHPVFTPLANYSTIEESACRNIIADCTISETIRSMKNSLTTGKLTQTKWNDTYIPNKENMKKFTEKYLHKKYDKHYQIKWVPGAQFAVDRDIIHNHNIEYYNDLASTLNHVNPISGHYLERLWDEVFS